MQELGQTAFKYVEMLWQIIRKDCERGPIAIIYDATTYKGTPLLVCFIAGKNADQYMDKAEVELKAAVLVRFSATKSVTNFRNENQNTVWIINFVYLPGKPLFPPITLYLCLVPFSKYNCFKHNKT